jgi:peptidase M23-like protein
VLVLALPTVLRAQEPVAHIRWQPAVIREGAVVVVFVTPAPGRALAPVHGRMSGEPLHFEPAPGGGFRALGAVPIGAPDSVPVEIHLEDSTGVFEGAVGWIPVAPRQVRLERIRVSPEFSRPPDSALAARIASERERVREVLRRTHDTPRLWDERFVRPRASRVTSGFATRRAVNGVESGRHWGTDLDGAKGAAVRVANHGVVAIVGEFYYGGCLMYVDHGTGVVTGYMHLSQILAAEGDTVRAGQVIGRVGATGRVTGPHLHWTANYGSVPVDPLGLPDIEPPRVLTPGPSLPASASPPVKAAPARVSPACK